MRIDLVKYDMFEDESFSNTGFYAVVDITPNVYYNSMDTATLTFKLTATIYSDSSYTNTFEQSGLSFYFNGGDDGYNVAFSENGEFFKVGDRVNIGDVITRTISTTVNRTTEVVEVSYTLGLSADHEQGNDGKEHEESYSDIFIDPLPSVYLTLKCDGGIDYFDGDSDNTPETDVYVYWYKDKAITTAKAKSGYKLKEYSGTNYDGTDTDTWDTCKGKVTDVTDWNMLADRSITVYSQPINYSIKYEGNGGIDLSESVNQSQQTYDQSFQIDRCNYTLSGYAFKGWNTEPNGSGLNYYPGDTVINLTNLDGKIITLYAQWEQLGVIYTNIDNDWKYGIGHVNPKDRHKIAKAIYVNIDGEWKLGKS